MKRFSWFLILGVIGLCGIVYYVLTSSDYINDLFSTNAPVYKMKEVLAQDQAKPEPLIRIWGTNTDLCFRLKPVPTYADTLKFLIDGYPAFQRWIESPAYNFCGQSLDHLNTGQHIARIDFKSPSGVAYSYTWVFEIKADGVVPEVTAIVSPQDRFKA